MVLLLLFCGVSVVNDIAVMSMARLDTFAVFSLMEGGVGGGRLMWCSEHNGIVLISCRTERRKPLPGNICMVIGRLSSGYAHTTDKGGYTYVERWSTVE